MLISSTTLKSSKFSSPLQRQVNFACPRHEDHFNFDQTLNQLIFDPLTKPSQLWSLHWSYVNSDPPHRNHVHFDHPHNNHVNFDANTKTMSFSGRVALSVVHTSTCSCDTAAIRIYNYEYQLAIFLRFPFFSKTPKILRQYIPYYILRYMVHTRLRVILVAGLCYVPFLLYVVFVGVIHRS